ncbi:WXG100 family type VII secretion target [Kitasatospora cinereorecta]|uniref:WXG100 family type VII secretion target n=1 Tax=Kitasatospora cinereorecta TaxID=285560 RepID=A0ABW0VG03_9ACTN
MSVNDWIDGKVLEILQAFGVELPGGDGDRLRSIAAAWDTMGDDLTAVARAIDSAVTATDERDWSGDARQAFEQHWQQQKQTVDQVAGNFHQVAQGLRAYADEIDTINKAIIDICVQIAEMEVAGFALSFVTAGISDLVANTAVAAKVAKVVDLVELFTTAAEKVAALLERFLGLAEETAATLGKVLTTVAKFGADFVKTTAESFVTNFVADTGSAVANQAVTGQQIDLGADAQNGALAAAGTAAFTGLGGAAARGAGLTGGFGRFLTGEGLAGTAANGAAGNIAGGLVVDGANGKDATTLWEDALTNAATGAAGNAQNHAVAGHLEEHGMLGGENRSDRAKLADRSFEDAFGTTLNTGVYAAGSGIESDLQQLAESGSGT